MASRPAISADGARVTFTSFSADLVGADGNLAVPGRLRARPGAARRPGGPASGRTGPPSRDAIPTAARWPATAGWSRFVNNDAGAPSQSSSRPDANNQPDVFAKELAPTDVTPPALVAAPGAAGVAGTASDPSGIGEITVNGAATAVGPGGAFSAAAAPGSSNVVRAVDGAGNAAQITVVARAGSVTPLPLRPRIQRLRASLKGRKLTVRFRLAADARVTVTLLRRTVRLKPRRRVVLSTVGRPLTKALKAGQRRVVLTLKKRPAAGRYVVRVRARAGALTATTTTALRVAPPKRR